MSERVFIDANIFLDVTKKRRGWQSSLNFITSVKEGKIKGYISVLTVAIVYFMRLRVLPMDRARHDSQELIKGFEIVAVTPEMVKEAYAEKKIEDLEDAIQFHCAKSVVKTFVTRNKKHYEKVKNEIEILTPEEFLKKYSS